MISIRSVLLIAIMLLAGCQSIDLPTTTTKHALTVRPSSVARLTEIKKVLGLHERKHRRQIQAMVGINPATTPWCGAAVGYAVRKTGGTPPRSHNRAISWRKWGTAVSLQNARPGDVVIYRFKRGHHVALFEKHLGKGRHQSCGGNMSNRFKCSAYRNGSVVAVRR